MKTKIEAQIESVNEARAEYNRLAPLLIAAARPFLGKKVKKVTGELTKEFKSILPKSLLHFSYLSLSNYSLYFVIKTSSNFGSCHCVYHEESIYFGDLTDGIFTKEATFEPRKCDYTVAEISELRKKADDAEKAFDKAKSALSPFSRY
jgi:hypothetical protein